MSLPPSPRHSKSHDFKSRSQSVDRANLSLKQSRNESQKMAQSHQVDGGSRLINRKVGMSRPVDESFKSSKNTDKFSLPLTLGTARLLETDIERIKRELKDLRQRRVK